MRKTKETDRHCVLARITVKPEAADTARGILTGLVTPSRKEAACVRYELYQQADQPHIFQTVEQWQDQAAAAAHMTTPHVGAAIAAAGPSSSTPFMTAFLTW